MSFTDKVCVITGASQGIGEAIALDLSGKGVEMALLDVQEEKICSLAKRIQDMGGRAAAYTADVSDAAKVEEVVEAIIREHKDIHFLINNAGITRDNLLMRMKESEWDAVLAVNLKGVFNLCRSVIRKMISSRFGRIVNISSVVGLMGNAGQTNYSASKAGVLGFTKSLAREVAARGVTVNAIAPGYIATPMTDILSDDVKKMFLDIIPMKRFGTPEEVSHVVRFLLSDEAAYLTGQVININGGMYM